MTDDKGASNSEAEVWDRRYAEHPWPTEPDARLVQLVSALVPGRAIDLGCGTGRNSIWLAQMGWSVTGVDGSPIGLSMAAAVAESVAIDVDLVEADLVTYVPAELSYDLVVVANMHFAPERRGDFYARAAAAVAPGGHLFVVGHHVDSLGRSGPPDAARLFSEDVVATFAAGLDIEFVEQEERWVNGESEPLVDVVMWARRPVQVSSVAP